MAIDWTNIYKKYKGLWVALKDDERTVVSFGKTAKEAWTKAKKKDSKSQFWLICQKPCPPMLGLVSK